MVMTPTIEARLRYLSSRFKGRFYFINGIIRRRTLHPTKGYRDYRWERFDDWS